MSQILKEKWRHILEMQHLDKEGVYDYLRKLEVYQDMPEVWFSLAIRACSNYEERLPEDLHTRMMLEPGGGIFRARYIKDYCGGQV